MFGTTPKDRPLKTPIRISKLKHRGEYQIFLNIQEEWSYLNAIRSLSGRKYSRTHQSWYIPYTADSWKSFVALGLPYEIKHPDESRTKAARSQSETEKNFERVTIHPSTTVYSSIYSWDRPIASHNVFKISTFSQST